MKVFKHFWLFCLIPLVVPLYFMPLEVNAGLIVLAAVSFGFRHT